MVSAGKIVGSERRHNESLVMFLLRNRRSDRYAAEVRPGHPLYERIRAEVLAEHQQAEVQTEESVLASLNAKLDDFRRRQDAVTLMLESDGSSAAGDAN